MEAMADAMDVDMDMDIDLGLDDLSGYQVDEEGGAIMHTSPRAPTPEKAIPEAYNDDFDTDFPVREKIHIKGLNHVAQPLVYKFLEEHVPDRKLKKLEWIDDDSANLVYYRAEDAAEALNQLTAPCDTLPSSLELRPAKPFTERPDLTFQIRLALVADKKKPGAKDRSAFYLFNPEWEPENRRGERQDNRRNGGRGGDRYNDRRGGNGRGRSSPGAYGQRRPTRPTEKTFTEDMYDDAPAGEDYEEGELVRRMSSASVTSSQEGRKKRKYDDVELSDAALGRLERKADFLNRQVGRLRDRSRSPLKEGDGRFGFQDEQPARKTARRRSYTPPGKRGANSYSTPSASKELFPHLQAKVQSTPLAQDNSSIELFPSHSDKRSRELFPHRTATSNHRRTDALDREETREIFQPNIPSAGGSLADRITGLSGQQAAQANGGAARENSFVFKGQSSKSSDFSIRGASNTEFSFRGAATQEVNPKVRELFPNKLGGSNSGKELFPNKRGRGAIRSKAEDFYD